MSVGEEREERREEEEERRKRSEGNAEQSAVRGNLHRCDRHARDKDSAKFFSDLSMFRLGRVHSPDARNAIAPA